MNPRRRVITAVLAVWSLAAICAPAVAEPASPACREGLTTVAVPVRAGVRVGDNRVNILIPPGYCSPLQRDRRYPVLYLLHGAGDTYRTWSTNTDVVSFSRSFPLIIVMPDGGHNSQAGWYSDWNDAEYQWEQFHMSILPDFVNDSYRTRPHDTAIAGLSMGGFGALSYAARHPGVFRAAASFSGAADTLYGAPASGVVFAQLNSQDGTPDSRVWGSQTQNEQLWAAHNPTSLAGKLRATKLFLASGTGTPGGPEGDDPGNPGGYVLENGIFQMNLSLTRALDAAGVPHTDDFYAGGYHGWPYWQADLHWALPQIASVLGT